MILLTGATGCVGSYLLESLLESTAEDLVVWVRSPEKLRFSNAQRLKIWQGGLESLEAHRSELREVSLLIHVATVWGGPQTFKINQRQSWQLIQALDPEVCRHIHLFSTASLLDSHHQPWPQAMTLGTDYIRSKAALHQMLLSTPARIPTSIYYPTVILGGDDQHSYSAAAAGLPELGRWLGILRHLKAEGKLHLIHARDIARIVSQRIRLERPAERLVLGNPAVSVAEVIGAILNYWQQTPARRTLNLEAFLKPLTGVLRPWMSDWDRFSLHQRQTVYQSTYAASYGLATDLVNLESMLQSILDPLLAKN